MKLARWLCAVLLLSVCATYSSVAHAEETLGLRLNSFDGEKRIVLTISDPLFLSLTIEHSAARAQRIVNQTRQRLLHAFKQTTEFQQLSTEEQAMVEQDYMSIPDSEISLGTATQPSHELVRFLVRDATGRPVSLKIESLAVNQREPAQAKLGTDDTIYYQYGIRFGNQTDLGPGLYSIAAVLNTINSANMWSGLVYSNTLQFMIVDTHPDPNWPRSNRRLHVAFLIADAQFQLAEQTARQWIGIEPDSIDAWHYLGESLYQQGRNKEALDALSAALEKFRLRYGESPPELPDVTLDLIRLIEEP